MVNKDEYNTQCDDCFSQRCTCTLAWVNRRYTRWKRVKRSRHACADDHTRALAPHLRTAELKVLGHSKLPADRCPF